MNGSEAMFAQIKLINEVYFSINLILEEIGIGEPVKRVGNNHAYSCPFHSDSDPSFYYNVEMNRYNCFSCNRKGGVYSLVKEWIMFNDQKKYVSFKDVQLYLQKVNPEYEILILAKKRRVSEDNRNSVIKSIKSNTPFLALRDRYIEDMSVYIHLVMTGIDPVVRDEFVF